MVSVIKVLVLVVSIYVTVSASQVFAQDTLAQWIKTCPDFDFILIDVRDPDELQSTGVIGSDRCKPYNLSSNQGILAQNISRLSKEQHIIIYCRSGSRASSAVSTLKSQGFSNVLNAGAISAWKDKSLIISAAMIKPLSNLPEPSMTANQCQSAIVKIEQPAAPSQKPYSSLIINTGKTVPSGYLFDIVGRKAVITVHDSKTIRPFQAFVSTD